MKNKIFYVLIIFVLSFATLFAVPQKQVQAVGFGLAIPGGITLGAGTYALGALGLAGIVGLAGYAEYEEEINAHAKGVWEGGTQTAMDSLNLSIEAAKGVGNGLVSLQTDFQNFIDGKLSTIATKNATLITGLTLTDMEKNAGFTLNPSTGSMQLVAPEGMGYFYTIKENAYPNTIIGFDFISSNRVRVGNVTATLSSTVYNEIRNVAKTDGSISLMMSYVTQYVPQARFAMASIPEFNAAYTGQVSKVREAWEGMKDAGLVLPVDSAVPLSSVDGSPLTYNPTADNYTGIDGGVYEGTPAWAFPQPKIRVANPDIPRSVPTTGVYVDTPVLTGNPAYDDTIINNPAIPKTTTNVQTGVTVGNPDIAITEPVPPVDGGGGTPPADGASCAKLKMPIFSPLKEQFSISFPFSIPWDIGRAINAAFSEIGDEKPEFKLDLKFLDKKHTVNITLPKMFDDWKPFTDSLLLFIFDVLIMFGIYRFVKGAGS